MQGWYCFQQFQEINDKQGRGNIQGNATIASNMTFSPLQFLQVHLENGR